MKNLARVGIAFIVVGLVACSAAEDLNPLPATNGRCDFRPKKPQCTDLRNYKAAVPAKQMLDGICLEGTTDDSTCPIDGMLGGCQTTNDSGSIQTNWFYSGEKYKTADDVKKQCTDDKATFVNPG